MRFAVEAWAPEYDVALDPEHLEEPTADIRLDVEMAAGQWSPITPDRAELPGCVVFVDGVRRIDARVWITDGDRARPGVCASVAAGAVRCQPDAAQITEARVFRGLYAVASDAVGPIVTGHGAYELIPCPGDEPDVLHNQIRAQMSRLEAQISAGDEADLVVFDGPLRGRADAKGAGFVKTQHVGYLPDGEQRVLTALAAGQRTPLFLIGGAGVTRWSWYLRLPGPVVHPLSGVVRCELPGTGTAVEAKARADQISAVLPRFASEPHKETRAPQNLYPIAGLEADLRHRLGDRELLERALRAAAAAPP